MTVAALFVDPRGPYFNRPDVDPWPLERDARKYTGPLPVVAHPPCNLWVNFAAVNWARYGKTKPAWYPGGTDGGCFESALCSVLQHGGVLEHPAGSHAWAHFGLIKPELGRWKAYDDDEYEYWVTEVWQSAYGHKARKRTWLLYAGDRAPFDLDWSSNEGTHQIGWFDRNKPTLGKRAASATPPAFADMLIRLAKDSNA